MTEHSGDESVLRDWVRVLARQKWIVLLAVTVVPLLAFATSRGQEHLYQASADVLVNAQNPTAQALNLASSVATPPDRYVATQAKLARVGTVAEMAVNEANLRDHTAASLLANSTVSADLTSDLLTFSVTDPRPAVAMKLASAYAKQFTVYRHSLDSAGLSAAIADARRKLDALAASGNGASELSRRLIATAGDLEEMQTLQAVGSSASVVGLAGGASLVQPRTKRNVILGVIVGLALGIALASIREALDTRVRSADELRARLGMPLLGRIPKSGHRVAQSRQLATLSEPPSSNTEAFRMLKNRLEIAQLEHDIGSIVITSPGAEQDRSTTAANLAVILAQSGRHVILVDLNLRSPSIDRLFGLRNFGFTGLAVDVEPTGALNIVDVYRDRLNAKLTDALNVVDVYSDRVNAEPGMLEVLTAGEPPPDPGAFLLSSFVAEALAALDERCDVLLIDAPPVLGVGDAMTIAKHTDAVILVAEINRARRERLIETRSALDGCPAVKLGVIAIGGYATERSSFAPPVRAALTATRSEFAGAGSQYARLKRLATRSARLVSQAAKELRISVALSSSVASERVRRSTRTRSTSGGSGAPGPARTAGRTESQQRVPHV
jgi:Mrp family chromosome partitioning ATPase/capsular polysaccharide biosynthesis protein